MPYDFVPQTSGEHLVYSVSQVNAYVSRLLSEDGVLSNLWMSGEISNFKHHSSGHLYFSLKDADGAINAVMFKFNAVSLGFEPKDGMQVEVQGKVSLYEKTGGYQFYVTKMIQKGAGDLFAKFEALKKKLMAEGLFDSSHKKPLPVFPRKVGVVTSSTGAAFQDIIRVSRTRFPGVELVLYPALVQGDGAALTIAEGVWALDHRADIDVIIVGRGGGAIEDLWCFNDENLARVIYAANTPIVSAVGHEIDFTISDFVADARAATPSNAAEMCVPNVGEWMSRVRMGEMRAHRALTNRVALVESHLKVLNAGLQKQNPKTQLTQIENRIYLASDRVKDALDTAVERVSNRLQMADQKLQLLNPALNFEKGFCYVSGPDGKALKSVKDIHLNDKVRVSLADGAFGAEVKKIED